jgi:polar amino acid transport system permease protein
MSTLDIIINYHEAILRGLWETICLCVIVWFLGIVLGIAIGIAAGKWREHVGVGLQVIAFIAAGVPVLVLLFWLYYPFQRYLGISVSPFWTAVIGLSFVNTLAVAMAVRNVVVEFPQQFIIAAKVCGMPPLAILYHIEIPICLRQLIPTLLTIQVSILQMSLFASLISVEELFRVVQRINSLEYQVVGVYSALAVFFLVVCLPLNGIAWYLRVKFTRRVSEY